MTLSNFLVPELQAPLWRADVVFQITVAGSGGEERRIRPVGHAGLVARATVHHSHGEDIFVYHMTGEYVEKHLWTKGFEQPANRGDDGRRDRCHADIAGSSADIEDVGRDDIVREAARFSQRRPSKLSPRAPDTCYWLGDPDPASHPLHPGARDAYAFSCATFVHHCYRVAGVELVSLNDVPFLTDEDRRRFEGYGLPVQPGPLRRLSCGHLICAFEADRFPFRPSDGNWSRCADRPVFSRLLAGSKVR